ncbi:3-phosphoshikimate 1-carboxyvinyltransferase [Desulfospira joergensenii]|uniref:3-phosphoshikimate 1-carboxyvinyltransferase n=1 Tax=Desulfospira joergensenii TaxID=53329 RepID=UPI0003B3009E|nr:3-phosphoshikimate 1-carboxyvinyltransferase [Desulfospira joergensenii]
MKKIKPRSIKDQTIAVPGSKSLSHRMLICAALAKGSSKITNLLESEDITLTTRTLACMGADIREIRPNLKQVKGFDGRPGQWDDPIYLGNSGTSMRLLAGIAGLGRSEFILTGDRRMCERPMSELMEALEMIGITARSENDQGTPPVHILGGNRTGGHTRLDCSKSSQYLSSLLMIGPFLEKGLDIELTGPPVSSPYIDLTMDVMKQFNVTAERISPTRYRVPGGQGYEPGDYFVEPDLSNAGYFWAAGAITGKKIRVENVSKDSLQGDLHQVYILEKMGCTLFMEDNSVAVKGNGLKGVDVDMSKTPDAVPAIAVTAAFAGGKTRITNIGHLREKECDRIDAVVSQLLKMGIEAKQGDDWMEITGGTPKGAFIETFNDHRIAMAFSLPGLMVGEMEIENPSCVEKSFPGYWEIFDRL